MVGREGGEEVGTGHHICLMGARSHTDSWQGASSGPFSKHALAEIP